MKKILEAKIGIDKIYTTFRWEASILLNIKSPQSNLWIYNDFNKNINQIFSK